MDKPILLVVGVDVCLNDIVLTNSLTLVGRFSGRNTSAVGVNKWVSGIWKDSLTQLLEVFLLPRGWLAFNFFFVADASAALAGSWRWDSDGLSFKCWSPLFNPQTKRYDIISIWIKIPNIPFEFWS